MQLVEAIDLARSLLNDPVQVSLTARTFPDNTSSFFTDNELMTYHNVIQQEVQQEIIQTYEDYFLTQTSFSIQAGCATYSLPSNFIKVRRVEDARNTATTFEILPLGLNERSEYYKLNRTQMWPGGYFLRGNTLVFDSTPTFTAASAVMMHYIKRLPDVISATDTSEIPAEHHRVVVWGIVKLALFKQQSPSELANTEYDKGLKKVREYAENRQAQANKKIQRRKAEVI